MTELVNSRLAPSPNHRTQPESAIATAFRSRHGSPAPSTSSSLTELSNIPPPQLDAAGTLPPKKRRKLNPAEKAAAKNDKEEKSRLRAEVKARKDEEKRRLAEEKEAVKREKEVEKAERLRDKQEQDAEKSKKKAKREDEKKLKESERQMKEAEKAQKEAEKLKKERSQMKLGAFFAKPALVVTPPSTPDDVSNGAISRRSSVASISLDKPDITTQPGNAYFLPFFVSEYTEMAPQNRLKRKKQDDLDLARVSMPLNIGERFGRSRKRQKRIPNVRTVLAASQNIDGVVIDPDSQIQQALKLVTYKYLHFGEDVRPPYQGTYTRIVPPRTSSKVSRNPFHKGLPDTNYDYDSEAEWEPPAEDDEDLEGDDAMSDAEDDEDEMADFLDDEDDLGRRKGPMMDLTPNSSGLCWSGSNFDDHGLDVKQYTMDVLHESQSFPIDPFSTKHWEDELRAKPTLPKAETIAVMQPPRLPLGTLAQNTLPIVRHDANRDGKPSTSSSVSNKTPRLIDVEFLADFKKAVHGSDLTKTGLIETLKKQFPKCSKDAIKDTLQFVAVRVGKKEVDKKWQLIEPV